MGFHALLFCPDEKLARVINQVFSEVEFTVDLVNEPFTAVKKLMAQHYDAIVVDCDNEQNCALLFKSARNSAANQNSLAIAVVEGQVGVAKAYRIGANLVITKPINVDQSRGTLRVARGLLRKNAESRIAASPSAPNMPPKESVTSASPLEPPTHDLPATATPIHSGWPQPGAPSPAMTAAAMPEENPVAPALTAAQTELHVAEAAPGAASAASRLVAENTTDGAAATAAWPKPVGATSQTPNITKQASGAAASPAPAKEAIPPAEHKPAAKKHEVGIDQDVVKPKAYEQQAPNSGAARLPDVPSFAALNDQDISGSGGKKFLMIAVAVLALAAAAYFGWTKFAGSKSIAAPQQIITASQPQEQTTPAAPVPMTSSSPVQMTPEMVSRTEASPTAPAPRNSSSQPIASSTASASASRVALNSAPQTKEPVVAPLVVTSTTPAPKAQAPVEEATAEPPAALAVESPTNNNLSGLISQTHNVKPTLAQVKVSQGVSQGLLIKRVEPKYPPSAVALHAQGAVQIEATIDKQGNVVNPRVISGNQVLAGAALEAVRQWRYKPYYLDGEPVAIQTQITINFKSN